MIDWIKSAELNECSVDWLKMRFESFPKSNKKIIAICDKCGKVREIYNHAYHSLCKSCGTGIRKPESIEKMQETRKNNPNLGKNISIGLKKYHKDNPEVANIISERVKKGWEEHPEQHNTDKFKEMLVNLQISNVLSWEDPEKHEKCSERLKEQWKNHPELLHNEAHKQALKKQIGGQDIVQHHYLYDDADLSKYTMLMTRSDHTAMHHRMRRDNYTVKHINSATDDNGLWGYR